MFAAPYPNAFPPTFCFFPDPQRTLLCYLPAPTLPNFDFQPDLHSTAAAPCKLQPATGCRRRV
jgi:hypothetical protein